MRVRDSENFKILHTVEKVSTMQLSLLKQIILIMQLSLSKKKRKEKERKERKKFHLSLRICSIFIAKFVSVMFAVLYRVWDNSPKGWLIFYWAHLCICTVGSYASLCVRLSVCPSVCPSVTGPKFRLDNNSYLLKFAR